MAGALKALENYYDQLVPPEIRKLIDDFVTSKNIGLWSLRGALKGFFLYAVPFSLLRRGVSKKILRRALAISVFIGTIRACDRFLVLKDEDRIDKINIKTQLKTTEKDFEAQGHAEHAEIIRSTLQHLPKDPHPFYRKLMGEYRHAFAGALAALAALAIDPELESRTFLCWSLIRSIRSIAPPASSSTLSSTFFLCLSSATILCAWVCSPIDLDPGYLRFLDFHGGQTPAIMKQVRSFPVHICDLLHPNDKYCETYFVRFFIASFVRAVKLYFPLQVIMLVLSNKKSLWHFVSNLTRSSTFLAVYCTLAFYSACRGFRHFPNVTQRKVFMQTWISGLAGLIERPGRRIELAGYVCTYALDAIFRTIVRKKMFTPSSTYGWLALSLCSAILIHNHDQQPNLFTHWLLGFDRVTLRSSSSVLLPLLHSSPSASALNSFVNAV
eukprot:TRINITY_DN17473_c0_g1_i1.p1 TRINITY_DN17473_c0_g1~~TRINITY_DN17473_c0_g1_i1.p1  ORF type:complete len:457 (-),score=128.74 TRINITY_DN17473_c0_g1_i1:49-1368(-)